MDKSCYQEIIDEISKKLADKIFLEEKNLVRRATSIDGDIADIVQDIGLKTCKRVLEKSGDQLAEKKSKKD
jgi:hypothetical protein